jgi:hypothetical protein
MGTGSRRRWSTPAGRRRPGSTAGCASPTARRSPCAPRPATAPSTRTSSSWRSRPAPRAPSG